MFGGGWARGAGHVLPRVLQLGGHQSGSTLMGFMRTAIEHEPGITRYRARLDSLIGDGTVAGASFTGGLVIVAGATVLATGGYVGLYRRTTHNRVSHSKSILPAARPRGRGAGPQVVRVFPPGLLRPPT